LRIKLVHALLPALSARTKERYWCVCTLRLFSRLSRFSRVMYEAVESTAVTVEFRENLREYKGVSFCPI